MAKSNNTPGKDVAVTEITDTALGTLTSLNDVSGFLAEYGITTVDISTFGSGFAVTDKAALVGKPFVILKGDIKLGKFGPMAVLHAMTGDSEKVIIVDGSSGIKDQCEELIERRTGQVPEGFELSGLTVKDGLTRSDYTYVDDKGIEIPATTYYLSGL